MKIFYVIKDTYISFKVKKSFFIYAVILVNYLFYLLNNRTKN